MSCARKHPGIFLAEGITCGDASAMHGVRRTKIAIKVQSDEDRNGEDNYMKSGNVQRKKWSGKYLQERHGTHLKLKALHPAVR